LTHLLINDPHVVHKTKHHFLIVDSNTQKKDGDEDGQVKITLHFFQIFVLHKDNFREGKTK